MCGAGKDGIWSPKNWNEREKEFINLTRIEGKMERKLVERVEIGELKR